MIKHYILQAVNGEGKSVYIDDVPNGKKCGCFCAECHGALIAKQGNIKAHHFAHASGNDSIKCSQTALHLLAKEIIAEEKHIPAFVNGNIAFVAVNSIEQEKSLGDIKPDLYAEYDGKPIAIEIFVSHAIDDEKFTKIQHHRLTTFEINLSELIFETREEVKQAIYDVKNISTIYDEEIVNVYLSQKKQILIEQGILKSINNGIVQQCHMCGTVINGRIVKWHNIRESFCKNCFFGCYSDDRKGIHCVGYIDDQTQIPSWFLQTNINENRFMSLTETQEKLNYFKREIRRFVV